MDSPQQQELPEHVTGKTIAADATRELIVDRLTTARPTLPETVDQIQRVFLLWIDGFLTVAEFEAMKAKLIRRP